MEYVAVTRSEWRDRRQQLTAECAGVETVFAAMAVRVLQARHRTANPNQLANAIGVDRGNVARLFKISSPFAEVDQGAGKWAWIDVEGLDKAVAKLKKSQVRRWLPRLGQLIALEVETDTRRRVTIRPLGLSRKDDATRRLAEFKELGLIVKGHTVLRRSQPQRAATRPLAALIDLTQDPEPDEPAAQEFARPWHARAEAEFPGKAPSVEELLRQPKFVGIATAAVRLVAEERHHGHMDMVDAARELAAEFSTDLTTAHDPAQELVHRLARWCQGFSAQAAGSTAAAAAVNF